MKAMQAMSSGTMPGMASAPNGDGAGPLFLTSLSEVIDKAASAMAESTATAAKTARQCTRSASTADSDTPATMETVQPVRTTPIVPLSRPGGAMAAALA